MNSYCSAMDDATIMEKKFIERNRFPNLCVRFLYLRLDEIVRRTEKQGLHIPVNIEIVRYRNTLTPCERCTHFKGEYPLWKE